jgi:hypothetical protein
MVQFRKSTNKIKKYDALTPSGKWIAFGSVLHQQYKDKTGLGLYSHMDHLDKKRRNLYRKRHKKTKYKKL